MVTERVFRCLDDVIVYHHSGRAWRLIVNDEPYPWAGASITTFRAGNYLWVDDRLVRVPPAAIVEVV